MTSYRSDRDWQGGDPPLHSPTHTAGALQAGDLDPGDDARGVAHEQDDDRESDWPSEEELERLIQAAVLARDNAYAPHSHFYVGAALLTHESRITSGCNVENASYSMTLCAERVAAAASIAAGDRHWWALAIASIGGAMPCGGCRQFLAEFGLDLIVVTIDVIDGDRDMRRLSQLLPDAFSQADLTMRSR